VLLAAVVAVTLHARPARAFLVIDWLSCRAEVASDGEGGLRFTGREICSLTNASPWGILFRPEPPDPQDRACRAKTAKAKRALENAKRRLSEKPACAAELNGSAGTALDTVTSVLNNTAYDGCAGEPPSANVAAQAAANQGPNTDIRFFNPFYGGLGGFDFLNQLNDDGLRRQMIVLHEIAHATGRAPTADEASERATRVEPGDTRQVLRQRRQGQPERRIGRSERCRRVPG
jgi:hypothetical protein